MDLDKLAQQVIRPLVRIELEWYGWHGFRRGIASNLYELGADEKVVQRILRHAKSHVTKERYIESIRSCGACSDEKAREFFGRHESECTKSAPNKLGQCGKLPRLPIRYETNNMTSNMTPLEAAMSPELNKTVGFVLIPTACPTRSNTIQ